MSVERQRSNWWFLLPIFFGIVGAIIAYFVLRHDDPKKAKNCLYLGLALLAVGLIIDMIFYEQLAELEPGFTINI